MFVHNIYSAEGALFNEKDLSLTELPPIPIEFQQTLQEAGGECNGFPNVRVVSGLDPDIQEYVGGRWWRKYAFREHHRTDYVLWHKPDGEKKLLSPKEADTIAGMWKRKGKKPVGILQPIVDELIIEHGVPRYFVEFYKPPELFGTEEAWNHLRYNEGEDGKMIDLMGEFPKEGMYETWFAIEEAVVDPISNEVVETKFRQLDDVALELILIKIDEAKKFTQSEQHLQLRKQVEEEEQKKIQETKQNIADIVASHADRLID